MSQHSDNFTISQELQSFQNLAPDGQQPWEFNHASQLPHESRITDNINQEKQFLQEDAQHKNSVQHVPNSGQFYGQPYMPHTSSATLYQSGYDHSVAPSNYSDYRQGWPHPTVPVPYENAYLPYMPPPHSGGFNDSAHSGHLVPNNQPVVSVPHELLATGYADTFAKGEAPIPNSGDTSNAVIASEVTPNADGNVDEKLHSISDEYSNVESAHSTVSTFFGSETGVDRFELSQKDKEYNDDYYMSNSSLNTVNYSSEGLDQLQLPLSSSVHTLPQTFASDSALPEKHDKDRETGFLESEIDSQSLQSHEKSNIDQEKSDEIPVCTVGDKVQTNVRGTFLDSISSYNLEQSAVSDNATGVDSVDVNDELNTDNWQNMPIQKSGSDLLKCIAPRGIENTTVSSVVSSMPPLPPVSVPSESVKPPLGDSSVKLVENIMTAQTVHSAENAETISQHVSSATYTTHPSYYEHKIRESFPDAMKPASLLCPNQEVQQAPIMLSAASGNILTGQQFFDTPVLGLVAIGSDKKSEVSASNFPESTSVTNNVSAATSTVHSAPIQNSIEGEEKNAPPTEATVPKVSIPLHAQNAAFEPYQKKAALIAPQSDLLSKSSRDEPDYENSSKTKDELLQRHQDLTDKKTNQSFVGKTERAKDSRDDSRREYRRDGRYNDRRRYEQDKHQDYKHDGDNYSKDQRSRRYDDYRGSDRDRNERKSYKRDDYRYDKRRYYDSDSKHDNRHFSRSYSEKDLVSDRRVHKSDYRTYERDARNQSSRGGNLSEMYPEYANDRSRPSSRASYYESHRPSSRCQDEERPKSRSGRSEYGSHRNAGYDPYEEYYRQCAAYYGYEYDPRYADYYRQAAAHGMIHQDRQDFGYLAEMQYYQQQNQFGADYSGYYYMHQDSDDRSSQHSYDSRDRSGSRQEEPFGAAEVLQKGRLTPHKHRVPHMKMGFTPNGQLVKVLPNNPLENEPARVEVHNVQVYLHDCPATLELKSFPGPLLKGETHKKDVIMFCQNKIRQCKENMAVVDRESAALLWELNILLIRQNGTVVGTDIADLLLKDAVSSRVASEVVNSADPTSLEVNEPNVVMENKNTINQSAKLTEEEIVDRFRELLLYGHKKDALEWMMKNHSWGHALFLASKMDSRTYANVMTRFANSLLLNDPLQTLYQLMSGRQPVSVTRIADDKWGDWKPHLAMVLSNGPTCSDLDQRTITALADTLATKGCLHAAQFCYLMADVGFGTYSKKSSKMVLLGSSHGLPFEQFATNEAIQCTEIYEYAMSLANPQFVLPGFQAYKFIYALRLAEYGFPQEALHYCEILATAFIPAPTLYSENLVCQVYDFAEKLKFYDPHFTHGDGNLTTDPPWLANLSVICNEFKAGRIQQIDDANIPWTGDSGSVSSATASRSCSVQDNLVNYTGADYNTEVEDRYNNYATASQDGQVYDQGYNQQNQYYSSVPYDAYTPQGDANAASPTEPNTFDYYGMSSLRQHHISGGSETNSYGRHGSIPDSQTPVIPSVPSPPPDSPRSSKTLTPSSPRSEVDSGIASTDTKRRHKSKEHKHHHKTKGWFGGIFNFSFKGKNEMKLPDDKNPSIVWDSAANKWINTEADGDDDKPLAPPPKDTDLIGSVHGSVPQNKSNTPAPPFMAPPPSTTATASHGVPSVAPPSQSDDEMMSAGQLPQTMSAPSHLGVVEGKNRYKLQHGKGPRAKYVDILNPHGTNSSAAVPAPSLFPSPVAPTNYFVPTPVSTSDTTDFVGLAKSGSSPTSLQSNTSEPQPDLPRASQPPVTTQPHLQSSYQQPGGNFQQIEKQQTQLLYQQPGGDFQQMEQQQFYQPQPEQAQQVPVSQPSMQEMLASNAFSRCSSQSSLSHEVQSYMCAKKDVTAPSSGPTMFDPSQFAQTYQPPATTSRFKYGQRHPYPK